MHGSTPSSSSSFSRSSLLALLCLLGSNANARYGGVAIVEASSTPSHYAGSIYNAPHHHSAAYNDAYSSYSSGEYSGHEDYQYQNQHYHDQQVVTWGQQQQQQYTEQRDEELLAAQYYHRLQLQQHIHQQQLQQQQQQQQQVTIPDVLLEQVAKALHITIELNGRLQSSLHNMKEPSSMFGSQRLVQPVQPQAVGNHFHHSQINYAAAVGGNDLANRFRGGENQVLMHSPPHPQDKKHEEHEDEEHLTVFHITAPFHSNMQEGQKKQSNLKNDVTSWGPDIEEFLNKLVDAMGLQEDDDESDDENENETRSIILALTMIYLDRACSVETVRSNGMQPCPFCTPRTVHRLVTTAFVLAVNTVERQQGRSLQYYFDKLRSVFGFGGGSDNNNVEVNNNINNDKIKNKNNNNSNSNSGSGILGSCISQLQEMVHWMQNALGDQGHFVSQEQLWRWTQTWNGSFNK